MTSLKNRIGIFRPGTAVPDHGASSAEAVGLVESLYAHEPRAARAAGRLYARSGIKRRHSVVLQRDALGRLQQTLIDRKNGTLQMPGTGERMRFFQAHASSLAAQACRSALKNAGCSGSQITHLITVSCTGFYAPGVDVELIDTLGLPATTRRIQVGFMGCHGMLNALRAARAIAGAQPEARVLVCAVELCSLHFSGKSDPMCMVADSLFADGAAAVVVAAIDAAPYVLAAEGSYLFPDSRGMMSWTIGDEGFVMSLSPQLPGMLMRNLAQVIHAWLGESGVQRSQVTHWLVHPGGPRILRAAAGALELPESALQHSRQILSDYGNMSSPTLLFILHALGEVEAGSLLALVGFGPGITCEMLLLRAV